MSVAMVTNSKLSELEQRYGGRLSVSSMKDTDYPKEDNVKLLRFAGARCPICGSDHWCEINVTGTKVICMRKKIEEELINGFKYQSTVKSINGYVYVLVDSKAAVKFDKKAFDFKANKTFPMAAARDLDTMNELVLAAYPLTEAHRKNLNKRGLSDDQIELHGSRSFGSFYVADENGEPYFVQAKKEFNSNKQPVVISRWKRILKQLNLPNDLWHGVPGFFTSSTKLNDKIVKYPVFSTNNGHKTGTQGMLVPYYDEFNRVMGFQVRVDQPKKYSKLIEPFKLHDGDMRMYINHDNTYKTYFYSAANRNGELLTQGKLDDQKEITISYGDDVMKDECTFKIETQAKYYWVSSSAAQDGADNSGKLPIQVAYNPEIAKLNPDDSEDYQKLKEYIQKPKAVWLTEGGLKGYIAVNNLSKNFSDEELEKCGRDVLAVAGVNSYHKFLPMLKKLNVHTVTIAYDMDMLTNDQVAANYSELVNMLNANGYRVILAGWDPDAAKGIDDALVANVPIEFTAY